MAKRNRNQGEIKDEKPYSQYDNMPSIEVMLSRLLIEENQAQLPVCHLGAGYIDFWHPDTDSLERVVEKLELEYRIEYDDVGNRLNYWFRRKQEEN